MAIKSFSLGMAVGYVLGARAGEQRYLQIVSLTQKVLDSSVVQRLRRDGSDAAVQRVRQVVGAIKERGESGLEGRRDGEGTRQPSAGDEEVSGQGEDVEEVDEEADPEEADQSKPARRGSLGGLVAAARERGRPD